MKKSKRPNIGVDRISELPDPVLRLILTCLHSTEEAVRTSALSTRCRYLWTSLPSIDIDISRGSKFLWAFDKNKFKEFVYWVLANRTQDLDSFTLHCRGRCLDYYDMSTIRRWIHIAVMRKAKKLVLPPCLVSNLDSYQHSLRHKNMKKSNQSEAPTTDNIVDRISSLPDPILHMILSRLHSTEEVIQTRVLSTRWKYLWTSIPSVDISCYRGKSRLARVDMNKFKEFVYWVLANSILDLDSFTLNCLEYSDNSTIGRWIYLLVMRKIKQLDLKFLRRDNGNVIVLPRCLVDCDSLEVLKLDLNWSFLSLSSFTGSRTLKVLKLDKVELLDHELVRKFLVNCPLLEELSLIDCYAHNLDYLSISCPNLKTLRIEHLNYCERLMVLCPKLMYLEYGGCKAKQLQLDVKSLKKAVIKHKYIQQKDEICKLFAQVSHVEYLSVKYFFVYSILSACKRLNCPEEGLLGSLPKLKTLELTLASLNLTFYKDITPEECEAFVEELDEVETRGILIPHLKKVEFLEFNGEKETLAIARFLLERGTSLKEMVFRWRNEDKYQKKSMEVMNEVSTFYQASLSVKLITLLKH